MQRTIAIIIALLTLMLQLTACGSGRRGAAARIAEELELELEGAKIETDRDDHGGFHGDGTRFVIIDCAECDIAAQLEGNPHWKRTPVEGNIAVLLYGGEGWSPVLTEDFDGERPYEPLFPMIENGYYYFFDRHDNARDPYSDASVLSRASFNFTAALYDCDTQTLYFCRFDT